jgi:UPF0716 protein FxsA
MAKPILTAVLLLGLAEIAAFILVAALIGVPAAFLLMLTTTLMGLVLLRRAGRGSLARLRAAVADGGLAAVPVNTGGLVTMAAGLLLFLPGFLTDLMGALLLIGPVRRWCSHTFRRWAIGRNPGDRSTIDLAPGEWRQLRDRELPRQSRNGD